jgi:hypothetical protein
MYLQWLDVSSPTSFIEIGNGATTLFWKNKWLNKISIQQIAPRLFAAVSIRAVKSRTVLEAITDRCWVDDITGALYRF